MNDFEDNAHDSGKTLSTRARTVVAIIGIAMLVVGIALMASHTAKDLGICLIVFSLIVGLWVERDHEAATNKQRN